MPYRNLEDKKKQAKKRAAEIADDPERAEKLRELKRVWYQKNKEKRAAQNWQWREKQRREANEVALGSAVRKVDEIDANNTSNGDEDNLEHNDSEESKPCEGNG